MSTLEQDLFSPTCCNPCFYYPCTVKRGKLSSCSGCKMILYCSKEHQKLDWPLHRPFCRAISALLKKHQLSHIFDINGTIKNQEDLNIVTLRVKYTLQSILKRSLASHEEELLTFPVMCVVCFSTQVSKLFQCELCNAVSYCSEDHRREHISSHRDECMQLKIYYCKFKIKVETLDKPIFIEKCDLLESNLANAMKKMFGIEFPPDPTEDSADYRNFSFVSDFSCVATVAYSFKYLEKSVAEDLTIYIVGATVDEIWFTPNHVEFLFACFPLLRTLNTIFIGPGVSADTSERTTYDLDVGRKLIKLSYKNTLEIFFAENLDHLKPDMIVSFNCGFSENTHRNDEGDTWLNGIRYMVEEFAEVPIVFTSYTSMEADFDYGALVKAVDQKRDVNSASLERLIPKEKNPYRDLRPCRAWELNDSEIIFYRNGYIQAVQAKLNG